ncbi:hypothetical protein VQ042_19960 [Aurantimonas sp. A2-1-M11]|uniref:hypothetical protein n=1 Tax=Aurantimonas sp. A2-1-M11 TaxID=3113712 RepID=UPI002F92183A
MIDQKKKRTRQRLGSRRQREKNRVLGVPTGSRIDRAIASILLSDVLRPSHEHSGEWLRSQLERAVAKDCGSAAAAHDENRNLIKAVKQRISYLLEQQSQMVYSLDFTSSSHLRYIGGKGKKIRF